MLSVYFASDRSSSGKSVITIAFSKALQDIGYALNVYKTGPDFIDAFVLSKALNLDAKNLDPFLIPDGYLAEWFFGGYEDKKPGTERGKKIHKEEAFVIESAMGLYDGNSYAIAEKFKFPVVLVMDSKRISSTMASLIYGLKKYKKGINVCGVILNNIASVRHFEIINKEIKGNISGIEVLGYVLNDKSAFSIKERHLGLTTPETDGIGIKEFNKIIRGIKEAVFKNVDLELLIKTLEKNSIRFNRLFLDYKKKAADGKNGIRNMDAYKKSISGYCGAISNATKNKKVNIAVAMDKAFFFYYNFNFEILKDCGAEIIFFSPLKDKTIPKNIKAIYIGGGYPEIYAGRLSENRTIIEEINKFSEDNGIIYAECGGLMYLCEKLAYGGKSFDMAGIFPFEATMDGGRLSLGYRTVRFKEKTFFGEAGLTANGHEFHYSKLLDSTTNRDCGKKDCKKYKKILEYENPNLPGEIKPEGYNILNTVGSYIHLSFFSNGELAKNFVENAGKL